MTRLSEVRDLSIFTVSRFAFSYQASCRDSAFNKCYTVVIRYFTMYIELYRLCWSSHQHDLINTRSFVGKGFPCSTHDTLVAILEGPQLDSPTSREKQGCPQARYVQLEILWFYKIFTWTKLFSNTKSSKPLFYNFQSYLRLTHFFRSSLSINRVTELLSIFYHSDVTCGNILTRIWATNTIRAYWFAHIRLCTPH